MEFENVSEQVEWEARRVAAAFGVKTFEVVLTEWMRNYWGEAGNTRISWDIDARTNTFFSIQVGTGGCEVNFDLDAPKEGWWFFPNPIFHDLMARGLYRLGFEDEGVMRELKHPLTAHEKLELRLSLPREFWPKTWLDEEGE